MKSETFIFNLLVSIIFIMNAKQIVLGCKKKTLWQNEIEKRKKVQIEIENEEITFV